MKYLYYWIPTPYRIRLLNLKDEISKKSILYRDISDIKDNDFIRLLKLEINSYNFDLKMTLFDGRRVNKDREILQENELKDLKRVSEYRLKCISYDENGFVTYKLPEMDKFALELLSRQVYHLYKDYFHKHEFHDPNNDSMLIANLSNERVSKLFLVRYYCELYVNKFESYKSNFEGITPQEIFEEFNQSLKGIKKIAIKDIISDIQQAKESLNNLKGEMSYANFLLFILEREGTRRAFEHYKMLFSKMESDFDIMQSRYEFLYERIDVFYADRVNKMQTILAWLGILLAIVTFI